METKQEPFSFGAGVSRGRSFVRTVRPKKTRMASLTGDVWECTKIHQFFPNLTIFEDLLRS